MRKETDRTSRFSRLGFETHAQGLRLRRVRRWRAFNANCGIAFSGPQ